MNRRIKKRIESTLSIHKEENGIDMSPTKVGASNGGDHVLLSPCATILQSVVSSSDISNDSISPMSVSSNSLAPTAEEEDFEEPLRRKNCETVIEMGEEEEILGLSYPYDSSPYVGGHMDVGHFLAGGAGLDSLTLEDIEDTESSQPPLVPISIWDNVIHYCDASNCLKRAACKCSACKAAYYCGENHQRLLWEEHRERCSPFRKTFLRDCGRVTPAVIAIRDIHEGLELFSEKPLLLFPLVSTKDFGHPCDCPGLESSSLCKELEPACLGCNKAFEFIGPMRHSCSNCGLPLCSKACEYLTSHKLGECHALSMAGITVPETIGNRSCLHGLYMDVEILRALHLRNSGDSEWKSLLRLRDSPRACLYRQSTHFIRFQRDIKRIAPRSLAYTHDNVQLVLTLHSIISSNSFKPAVRSTFKVIFRTQADFSHSCLPNTVHYVENESVREQQLKLRIFVKAAVAITKGELISVDFLPSPYLPYVQRRNLLEDMGINCICDRCVQPSRLGDYSAHVRCGSCRDGYVHAETPLKWSESVWSCSCMEEMSFSAVSRIEHKCLLKLIELPKRKYQDVNGLVNFINESTKESLHPSHALIIHAWCYIESLLRKKLEERREPDLYKRYDQETLRNFRLILEYSKVILNHFDAIRPGLWVDRGIVLFNKFYAHFALECDAFHEGRIDRKEFTIKLFKSLNMLKSSLQILIPFDGTYSNAVSRTIQEATSALTTLKQFTSDFIKQPTLTTPSTPL